MLNRAGWTLVRVAPGEPSRAAWLGALVEPGWRERAQTLKEDGDDWVGAARLRVAGADREVVVKHRRTRGPGGALKVAAGAGRLMRQWRGGVWLGAHGIPTARPLALVRRTGPLGAEEVLVMERLRGRTLLEHLASGDLTGAGAAALAREVGSAAARLVGAGRYNRDHKPSNLIVTRADDRSAEVAVIDAVAIRPTTAALRGLDRMLASLLLEPIGCGCAPSPWERRRVVRGAAEELVSREPSLAGRRSAAVGALAWELWSAAAEIIEAHGDATPRVNPLAAPARPGGGPGGGQAGG